MSRAQCLPDPRYDVVDPGGMLMFRSCSEGYLHSVVLDESARGADTRVLAEAILLSAAVSHLKAVMQMRQALIDAGFTPSEEMASPADLDAAQHLLASHYSP